MNCPGGLGIHRQAERPMFRISRDGRGIGDANMIEGAREIVRGLRPGPPRSARTRSSTGGARRSTATRSTPDGGARGPSLRGAVRAA